MKVMASAHLRSQHANKRCRAQYVFSRVSGTMMRVSLFLRRGGDGPAACPRAARWGRSCFTRAGRGAARIRSMGTPARTGEEALGNGVKEEILSPVPFPSSVAYTLARHSLFDFSWSSGLSCFIGDVREERGGTTREQKKIKNMKCHRPGEIYPRWCCLCGMRLRGGCRVVCACVRWGKLGRRGPSLSLALLHRGLRRGEHLLQDHGLRVDGEQGSGASYLSNPENSQRALTQMH